MEAIETLASLWIEEHPEYFADLDDVEAADRTATTTSTPERTNPFLHLSMHLSISEQCSIDQPRGIRQAVELLAKRLDGGLHDAHHAAMECLGQMLADSQRNGLPPDGATVCRCRAAPRHQRLSSLANPPQKKQSPHSAGFVFLEVRRSQIGRDLLFSGNAAGARFSNHRPACQCSWPAA